MLPAALFTVSTPSPTFHLAGDLSWAETHSSRLRPSKRTIASEGGAVQLAPGVTTFGTGSQTSVSCGLAADGFCAKRGEFIRIRTVNTRERDVFVGIIFKKRTYRYGIGFSGIGLSMRIYRIRRRSKGRRIGGPGRDRTDDLFHAMEARSQLRHRPTCEDTTTA